MYIRPYVSFGHVPIIATLLVLLSTYFIVLPLAFALRDFAIIITALILAEFAPLKQ
nr:MAG TPA: hypothetical protein [Bacteriophage sp.]